MNQFYSPEGREQYSTGQTSIPFNMDQSSVLFDLRQDLDSARQIPSSQSDKKDRLLSEIEIKLSELLNYKSDESYLEKI